MSQHTMCQETADDERQWEGGDYVHSAEAAQDDIHQSDRYGLCLRPTALQLDLPEVLPPNGRQIVFFSFGWRLYIHNWQHSTV